MPASIASRCIRALALCVVLLNFTGCATSSHTALSEKADPSPPATIQLSGRMSLKLQRAGAASSEGASLVFDFKGNDGAGELLLQTLIGTTVAQARWNAQGAEITTPQGTRQGSNLDEVAQSLLGEPLPLAALLNWLRAQPWSGAPHESLSEGFRQLGWEIGLAAYGEGVVTAYRPAGTGQIKDAEILVRARMDRPTITP